jgi:hypothetical protein
MRINAACKTDIQVYLLLTNVNMNHEYLYAIIRLVLITRPMESYCMRLVVSL